MSLSVAERSRLELSRSRDCLALGVVSGDQEIGVSRPGSIYFCSTPNLVNGTATEAGFTITQKTVERMGKNRRSTGQDLGARIHET